MATRKARRGRKVPEGSLTGAQFEILEAIWEIGGGGATVKEIWEHSARDVAKTTVLNQVLRLESRHWVERLTDGATARFVARVTREQAQARLAGEFVKDFFGGSAAHLVQSLLGANDVREEDLATLRRLLDEAPSPSDGEEG
ncbi:MAG: BlaI/MecI/CopY family transcriptional regulator [Planctomycetes bacterium]|nr:BlaI/MecI/CopY family transcriptional regulator [Planctomycetota bacterium]MCB9891819.1 BlaI/MecI/CopY family transcriptional regulator [Planctomycetota bacterium]